MKKPETATQAVAQYCAIQFIGMAMAMPLGALYTYALISGVL